MTINYRYVLGVLLAGLMLVGFLIALTGTPKATASITYSTPTLTDTFVNHTFLVATTTTATSTNETRIPSNQVLRIDGAKKVTFYFTHGGAATTSTGGARFSVDVSKDSSTWTTFNKLIGSDVSSTATSTVTVQGATSTIVTSMKLTDDTFHFARCISTELSAPLGVDGDATCSASAEY